MMAIDSIPEVTPIVEGIDNFVNNRRLALLFEARVGKGRLLVSSIDLLIDGHLPELRQMRFSLTKYMLGEEFHPSAILTEQDVRNLVLKKAVEQKTEATSVYH